MNIDQYLQRLNYQGPWATTSDVLEALHEAHLRAVPFENLSIHRQEGIVLNEAHLFEKMVLKRRGGFCYELNGLFAVLLRELGFEVQQLSANVYQANGAYSPDFDHLALLVTIDRPYLVDVGFGDAFLQPLRLQEKVRQVQGPKTFVLERAGAVWTLTQQAGTEPPEALYRFNLEPHPLSDFAERCLYHQHSSESHFTKKTVCTRATPEGRITLSGNQLIVTENGERSEETISESERAKVLEQHFGIILRPVV